MGDDTGAQATFTSPQRREVRSLCGGELEEIVSVVRDLYKSYFSTERVLVNYYSSTETGPISFYLIDEVSRFVSRVPIGYPIKRIEIQIIDEAGKPV